MKVVGKRQKKWLDVLLENNDKETINFLVEKLRHYIDSLEKSNRIAIAFWKQLNNSGQIPNEWRQRANQQHNCGGVRYDLNSDNTMNNFWIQTRES